MHDREALDFGHDCERTEVGAVLWELVKRGRRRTVLELDVLLALLRAAEVVEPCERANVSVEEEHGDFSNAQGILFMT
jgi:hypothetical protein